LGLYCEAGMGGDTMKPYLLLDTSMWGLLVGLGTKDGVLLDFIYFPEQRVVAQALAGYVGDLLTRNGVSRSDLAEIRVSQGPGSFTGIRMGLAWAYGFSAGSPEIALVGLSSLEAIAEELHAQRGAGQRRTAVFLENKGTAGYVAVVEAQTATYACEIGESRVPGLTGDQAHEQIWWVRPWAALEAAAWATGRACTEAEYVQLVLHGMLRKRETLGEAVPMPRYLRSSTAEEALEKKKGALV
jgi:tRNA threonylcarbamoyl adenosine modification protein YeaZ